MLTEKQLASWREQFDASGERLVDTHTRLLEEVKELVPTSNADQALAIQAEIMVRTAAMLPSYVNMLCAELRGIQDQLDRIRGTIANTLEPKR